MGNSWKQLTLSMYVTSKKLRLRLSCYLWEKYCSPELHFVLTSKSLTTKHIIRNANSKTWDLFSVYETLIMSWEQSSSNILGMEGARTHGTQILTFSLFGNQVRFRTKGSLQWTCAWDCWCWKSTVKSSGSSLLMGSQLKPHILSSSYEHCKFIAMILLTAS